MTNTRRILIGLCTWVWVAGAQAQPTPEPFRPRADVQSTLRDAKHGSASISDQVGALVDLAWPSAGSGDPELMAAARQNLVSYGHHALPVLRQRMPTIPAIYQADAVAALIDARFSNPAGMPPDYLTALELALWYGSPEAQRIAGYEVVRYNFPASLPIVIDACYMHPVVARALIQAIGRQGDKRTFPFLRKVFQAGAPPFAEAAARAMVTTGALSDVVQQGLYSDDASTRRAAWRALLPRMGVEDLEELHSFSKRFPDDPAELHAAVRERIEEIELYEMDEGESIVFPDE